MNSSRVMSSPGAVLHLATTAAAAAAAGNGFKKLISGFIARRMTEQLPSNVTSRSTIPKTQQQQQEKSKYV
jgi:hypothetical protein